MKSIWPVLKWCLTVWGAISFCAAPWIAVRGMRALLLAVALMTGIPLARADPQPDIYSSNLWEINGQPTKITWIEIHNSKEAQSSGITHVSVHARKKGSPVWELEWVCSHIAITTDALKRSVIRPLKERGAYPEHFYEAYHRWQADEKNGKAIICSTSIQEWLKEHQ